MNDDQSPGLYVPGVDGSFKRKVATEPEARPLLVYEADTGVLILNFQLVFNQHSRRVSDVVIQSKNGMIAGVLITSEAMGPEEIRQLANVGK